MASTQIEKKVSQLRTQLDIYFQRLEKELNDKVEDLDMDDHDAIRFKISNDREKYWSLLSLESQQLTEPLIGEIVSLGNEIVSACRSSVLVSEPDMKDIMIAVKTLRAAVRLRRFYYQESDVIHDEGSVLGIQPASQAEADALTPSRANLVCQESLADLMRVHQLAGAETRGREALPAEPTGRFKPDSAFIMMWMDPEAPELEDVKDAVKETFGRFGIKAVRADEIEHEGVITQRILDEIRSAEFLFADLSGARPNVYYEVGYAHALGKRVILYRREGTGLHFDLAGYNCPGYTNLSDLKKKLTRRLEEITNTKPD